MPNKIDTLREKAGKLPACPGVYLMKNRDGTVIYVGKSRKLCQRVSSYFTGTNHTVKTARMVSQVHDFDTIVCDSEIEALGLENTLIKKYSPRYNIKLKDAKSYPYIKMTGGAYPRVIVTRQRKEDGGRYFGPYSGTTDAYANADTVTKLFRLPTCKRRFPEDIGKDRPCIYRQMHRCLAPCAGDVSEEEYRAAASAAAEVLSGNYRATEELLKKQMTDFAENEQFEAAARVRDAIVSLRKLGDTQKVLSSAGIYADVWSMHSDDVCGALSVLCIRAGSLNRKNDFTFPASEILTEEGAADFIADFYHTSGDLPKEILLDFSPEREAVGLLAEYLSSLRGKKVTVLSPQRGEKREMCEMARKNALLAAEKYKQGAVREEGTLVALASLLQLEVLPERIEVYDISNIGAEYTTGGMIVYEDGRLCRNRYRTFRVKSVVQDDYGAMREVLTRRFSHVTDEEEFGRFPDLILLDGGAGHVRVGREVLSSLGLSLPLFGLVKDDFHKTRALTDGENEISCAHEQPVYVFLYQLQEEVHRHAVGATMGAKSRSLRHSSLEKIPGVGKKRAKLLLDAFGGLGKIKEATVDDLAAVKGIPHDTASTIYLALHGEDNENEEKGSNS